jgi:glutamine phosphoribosylpyrophosphate amidotransferase
LKISEEIMMNYSISDIPIEDYNKCKLIVDDSIIRGYTLSPTSQKD